MKNQTVTLALLSVLAIFASVNANAARSPVDVLSNNELAKAAPTLDARSAVDVLTNNELAQASAPEALTAPTPAPVFPNAITVQNNSDRAAWITIYNSFGSIRDAGCVRVGDYVKFHNYYGPIPFKVRAEITTNADCSGSVVFDTNMQVGMPLTGAGVGVTVEKSGSGYYLD